MSTHKAWKRLCDKNTPSKMVNLSPIKPISHHMCSMDEVQKDPYLSSFTWTLMNTEEFFYQNAGSLVHFYYEDDQKLKKVLNDSINVVHWNSRLVDLRLLGQGSFGKVYMATDKVTGATYALKNVVPPSSNSQRDLFSFISSLFVEQNNFSQLNKSPFFVRLLAAFQDLNTTNFWFVLEYCFCDLKQFISLYEFSNYPNFLLEDYIGLVLLERVHRSMTKTLKVDYTHIVHLYFFEMLCALHYLASRHIVHADIKPDNVLVSITAHVKLADFGLSFKNDWFDRMTMPYLPSSKDELERLDKDEQERSYAGTIKYFDPEQRLKLKCRSVRTKATMDRCMASNPFYKSMTTTQNFLSDLYAVGLTVFELIFGGLNLTGRKSLIEYNDAYWDIDVIFNRTVREKNLVEPLLKMSKDNDTFSILTFLLSILQPRQIRAENFLSEITIFRNGRSFKEKFIDINKVENIFYFKAHDITKANVSTVPISENMIEVLHMASVPKISLDSGVGEYDEKLQRLAFKLHTFEYTYPDVA